MYNKIILFGIVLFMMFASGCIIEHQSENCEVMESDGLFGRDGCWLDKAEADKDLSLCDKIAAKYDDLKAVCVGRVAAARDGMKDGGSKLCEVKYPVTERVPGYVNLNDELRGDCLRTYAQKTLGPKIEACKKLGGDKAEACLLRLAVELKDTNVCHDVKAKSVCYTMVAIETKTSAAIMSFVSQQERDQWLALYFSQTFDESVLKDIKEAKYYNYALISAITTAWGEHEKAPVESYCDVLRNDYTYEGTGETVEEMYKSDKNICEMMVAAVNEITGKGQGWCDNVLPGRLANADDDEKADNVESCKKLVSKVRSMQERIKDANPQQVMQIMKEIGV